MKRLRRFIITVWQPLFLYTLFIGVLVVLLGYKLGTLPAHSSPDEVSALQAAHGWRDLLNNPLYAPHKLVLLALQLGSLKGLAVWRAVSVGWTLLTIFLLFGTLKHWFTTRIALLGTLLFASSTWLLVDARSITPEIMQASLVSLLAIGGWLRYSRARILPILCGVGLTALLCYVPGMLWFIALALLWQRRAIRAALEEAPLASTLIAMFMLLVMVAPLLFALVRSPDLVRPLLGLPEHFSSWQQMGRNLLDIPLALFVRAPANPGHWLGHLPLLDVFSLAMFVLGIYGFYYQRQLDRAKVLIALGCLAALFVALGGGVTLIMLLPVVYIVVTAGINLMLQQWLTVFPRNPLARWLGASLLVLAVVLTSFYQLDRYYQAWQHAPATKEIYSRSL